MHSPQLFAAAVLLGLLIGSPQSIAWKSFNISECDELFKLNEVCGAKEPAKKADFDADSEAIYQRFYRLVGNGSNPISNGVAKDFCRHQLEKRQDSTQCRFMDVR